jgi:acyl-CoA thioester hydrolase
MNEKLVHESRVNIRFNEVDVLGIVWHGHYIKYFEDGREDFGRKYGLGYMDFYREGFLVPIVSIQCDYKRPLIYGDELNIRTVYEPSDAAKLIFHYFIYRNNEQELVAQGKSVQVFLSRADQQLQIINPPFFESWKTQNLR